MGKAGKERKRCRIEAAPVNDDDEEEDGGDSDAEEELAGEDISSAAQLLDCLYWDLKAAYASKELKPLRTALFPLIQQQAKAHFEIIPPKIRRTTPLEPREVALLKRVAAHFASSDGVHSASFASLASHSSHPPTGSLEPHRRCASHPLLHRSSLAIRPRAGESCCPGPHPQTRCSPGQWRR